jgi:hypothetical protein
MWQIEYTARRLGIISYDSYPETQAIWQTIKSLAYDVVRVIFWLANTQLETNVFLWEVDDHWVVYERDVVQRKLLFFVLKPADEDSSDAVALHSVLL